MPIEGSELVHDMELVKTLLTIHTGGKVAVDAHVDSSSMTTQTPEVIMNTDYPSTTICFRLGHGLAKMRVYTTEQALIRKLIVMADGEIINKKREKECEEVDTRVLGDIIRRAIPKLIRHISPSCPLIDKKLKDRYQLGEIF